MSLVALSFEDSPQKPNGSNKEKLVIGSSLACCICGRTKASKVTLKMSLDNYDVPQTSFRLTQDARLCVHCVSRLRFLYARSSISQTRFS
jgi:hypothetical protein